MKNALCFLLTLLSFANGMASVIPSELKSELKRETEIKVNLTSTGHKLLKEKLLKEFKVEEATRQDFYFEIFENNDYQLKKASPPIKLRFMWDGLDLKWQIQQTTGTSTYSFLGLKETLSESFELKANTSKLLDKIKAYHALLNDLKPEALIIAREIQNEIEDQGLLEKSQGLCPQCKHDKFFYSSHINEKARLKLKLKLENDQLNIQLGETINHGVASFELEAEIKKSANHQLTAERLKNWLYAHGMKDSHIETKIEPDASLVSLKSLIDLHSN